MPLPQPQICVVQAIPKGDRGEQAVETMTEIGVDVIVPWAAERCVAVWDAAPGRSERGLARWRSAAREAAKQSRRARVPEVTTLAGTADVLARAGEAASTIVLDPGAGPDSAPFRCRQQERSSSSWARRAE